MRNQSLTAVLAATLALCAGTAARAQGVPNAFLSTIASGCVPDRPDLAHIDMNFGTVSFAPNRRGLIKLTCPVTFVVQPSFANVLSVGLTFYNDHGVEGGKDHCAIQASFLRSNLSNVEGGLDILDFGTGGKAFLGRQSLTSNNVAPLMDFSTSFYWVFIQLSRDSASAACNPVLVGTYLVANME